MLHFAIYIRETVLESNITKKDDKRSRIKNTTNTIVQNRSQSLGFCTIVVLIIRGLTLYHSRSCTIIVVAKFSTTPRKLFHTIINSKLFVQHSRIHGNHRKSYSDLCNGRRSFKHSGRTQYSRPVSAGAAAAHWTVLF